MQLALTPEVLFPVGACAVVAAAVIAVIVVLARGKRAVPDDTLLPTAADWTGETATADTAPDAPAVTMPPLPQRLTVAEAVAVRDADTAPLPVSSARFVAAGPIPAVPMPPRSDSAGPSPVDAGPELAGPKLPDPEICEPAPAQAETAIPEAGPAEAPGAVAATAEATAPAGSTLRTVATSTGPSPVVAAAVAHVLAYRAAVGRAVSAQTTGLPVVPNRTADARDRLLAVLLADPVRAVGAAEELAACRGQLGDVLARLAASGLSPDQLSRLSGFTVEQVTILLDQQSASR